MQYLKLEKWVGGVVFKDVFMSPESDVRYLTVTVGRLN